MKQLKLILDVFGLLMKDVIVYDLYCTTIITIGNCKIRTRIPLVRWSLYKYKCLQGVGGKGRSSSLQEGASHTYTLRLNQSRNSILYQKIVKYEKTLIYLKSQSNHKNSKIVSANTLCYIFLLYIGTCNTFCFLLCDEMSELPSNKQRQQ